MWWKMNQNTLFIHINGNVRFWTNVRMWITLRCAIMHLFVQQNKYLLTGYILFVSSQVIINWKKRNMNYMTKLLHYLLCLFKEIKKIIVTISIVNILCVCIILNDNHFFELQMLLVTYYIFFSISNSFVFYYHIQYAVMIHESSCVPYFFDCCYD